jgi:NADPH:quinone reductase-like Zn-dependent oxidoreductase
MVDRSARLSWCAKDEASLGRGTTVLVNGASGAVGTNAVQLAKRSGATVTGVTSTANVGVVTELGADRVLDYTRDDLSCIGERFDVVLDTVGNLTIASGRRLLADGGVLLLAVAGLGDTLRARGDVAAGTSPERAEDFEYLLGLVAAGHMTVVLERSYTLEQIADAYQCVDSGHKVGNVVVRP